MDLIDDAFGLDNYILQVGLKITNLKPCCKYMFCKHTAVLYKKTLLLK